MACPKTNIELCRDRWFTSRHVTNLPRRCRHLSVDYARVDELPSCRQMVLGAADRGDNVGVDQYKSDEEFESLLDVSEVFVGKDSRGDIVTFIVVQPSWNSRTWDTCWASIYVFYTEDMHHADRDTQDSSKTLYSELVQLAVELVAEIDLGYTDCMVCVASSCRTLVESLRRLGFIVIATIPNSVQITGVGIVDDLWLAKALVTANRQRRSQEEVLQLAETHFPSDKVAVDQADLVTFPFLPQRYVFQNGIEVEIRSMRKHEDHVIYELIRDAAEHGDGYGQDEFPTLSSFRGTMLMESHCFVFEELATGKVVGYTLIGDSWHARRHGRIYESSLVVTPEFRGRGVGKELTWIDLSIAAELGYEATVNDWLGSNRRMAAIMKQQHGAEVVVVGCLARGAYTTGLGWDDLVIMWHDLRTSGIRTLTEIAEQSRQRATAGAVSKL